MNKKNAFTLAEVLITLGIIGIVAAMTLPVVTGEYRKKIAESRLKKFYSDFNQAMRRSELDNGEFQYWDEMDSSMDSSEQWYMKYINPYLKSLDVKRKVYDYTVWVKLVDGSGFGIRADGDIYFYTDAKYLDFCENLNLTQKLSFCDGTKKFLFHYYTTSGLRPYGFYKGNTRKFYFDLCGNENFNERNYCASLIYIDGWEIKNDYPIKF